MAFMAGGLIAKRAKKKALDAIFSRFDHNQNGRVFVKDFFEELRLAEVEVDEDEVQKLTALADEDGQVNRSNFERYCKTSAMFQSLDKNHDGVISDIEVTSKAELAFKALDRNNDGFISKREFENISKHLTKEQIAAVMGKFDSDGDGKLSYGEFKKLLKR